ncbi:MAG TPA: helix-hairpin-helix domain-containing protein, partial [Methanobacteriaceae archaeon]|nr:helix-hairpin-helix domain-containing protein [Methanobacteriaceae archaeon]
LKEYATQMEELDLNQLIYRMCRTPDMPLISFKGRKSKDPVREKLSARGIFAVDMRNEEATTASLMEWIDERNEYEIENAFHVYAATTRRAAYEASLMVKFFKNICEVSGIYAHSRDLEILSARLYYGVKDELIPLVLGVKRLGRKRARALVKTFGEDLRPFTEKELQKVDGIGPKLSASIVRYARGD